MASFLTWHRVLLLAAVLLFQSYSLLGQIIYGLVFTNSQTYFYKFNLSTCEFCAITPPLGTGGGADIIMLPNGQILRLGSSIQKMEAPPSSTVLWESFPGFLCGQLTPAGLVYLSDFTGLSIYDPATNNITFIGNWPGTISTVREIFYINGVLYGNATNTNNGQSVLVQINTSDPSQTTIISPMPNVWGGEGGIWNGNAGVFYTQNANDIYFHNPTNGSNTLVCDLPNNLSTTGLTAPPPGLPEYPCIVTCTTDAGTLPAGGPYNICTNGTLNFPPSTGTTLDANDLLRYILFSNPADTAGSIVAVSATPSFTFAPPMQTGVTYYIAAMAGNGVNGNIDLNDPCLDFSNALQVTWRPLPAVSFSVAGGNTNVCSAGDCRTLTATFTGTPPFTLSYTALGSTFTQTFSGNTGTFQVCVPAGTPTGPLQVQATALTDGWCTCQ